MKSKIYFFIVIILLLFYSVTKYFAPSTITPIIFQDLPLTDKAILLPLDSRPPCTDFVEQLGALGTTKIILPPKAILGNYELPAERSLLYHWFSENNKNASTIIVSSDLLIHGGLVGSRLPLGEKQDFIRFNQFLHDTRIINPSERIMVYSIIPRLLISDQIIPDSWWQWHLMRWAELQDIEDTFGDPISFAKLQELKKSIPQTIIDKYSLLYKHNDEFNHQLMKVAEKEKIDQLIIGQDDGQPFGLPNRNRNHALFYIEHNKLAPTFATTRGADELSALLLAADRNKVWQYQPKIYVEYSSTVAPDLIMPFMSCSVGENVYEKINIIGGHLVNSPDNADFILYIHCGSNTFSQYRQAALRIKELLKDPTPVALVDLTANYEAKETLFPVLIQSNVPIVKLAAYAGWNTASNSIGTAIAQASIFTAQKQRLAPELLPSLYATNLKFNLERFFDDWVYQKLLHSNLKNLLTIRELDTTSLGAKAPQASKFIQNELDTYRNILVNDNLSKYPFFTTQTHEYFLTDLELKVTLPWSRLFEIELSAIPTYGQKQK